MENLNVFNWKFNIFTRGIIGIFSTGKFKILQGEIFSPCVLQGGIIFPCVLQGEIFFPCVLQEEIFSPCVLQGKIFSPWNSSPEIFLGGKIKKKMVFPPVFKAGKNYTFLGGNWNFSGGKYFSPEIFFSPFFKVKNEKTIFLGENANFIFETSSTHKNFQGEKS